MLSLVVPLLFCPLHRSSLTTCPLLQHCIAGPMDDELCCLWNVPSALCFSVGPD